MADWQGLAIGTIAWGAGCNRCTSMVHVCVAIYLCMASVRDWSRPMDGIGGPSSSLQLSFVFVFSLSRLGAGPYVVYKTLTSQSPFVVKCVTVGIQVVSIFWFDKNARTDNMCSKWWTISQVRNLG